MLLMIDNYDSFTYNLVQYFGELGEEILVYRNDKISIAEIEALAPERIVVSPGPCTPNEAGISLDLIEHFKGTLPLLGVCLGHQSIGQAYAPPKISFLNSNPSPRAIGSSRIQQSPNCPCPPVCFLCRPRASALFLMVSR